MERRRGGKRRRGGDEGGGEEEGGQEGGGEDRREEKRREQDRKEEDRREEEGREEEGREEERREEERRKEAHVCTLGPNLTLRWPFTYSRWKWVDEPRPVSSSTPSCDGIALTSTGTTIGSKPNASCGPRSSTANSWVTRAGRKPQRGWWASWKGMVPSIGQLAEPA